jgi:hypothetical protein
VGFALGGALPGGLELRSRVDEAGQRLRQGLGIGLELRFL